VRQGVIWLVGKIIRIVKGLFIDLDEEDERLELLKQKKGACFTLFAVVTFGRFTLRMLLPSRTQTPTAEAGQIAAVGDDDDALESLMKTFSLYACSTVSIWMTALSVAIFIVFRGIDSLW